MARSFASFTDSSTVVRSADSFPSTPSRASAPPKPLDSYGPTERSDTLWEIALEMRSDSGVSVPQMMLALLQENPEAFYGNNINNLKAGYVLRAPDRDVINALSKQAAAAEANRQYQEWLAVKGRSGATTLAGSRRQVVEGAQAGADGASSAPGASAAAPTEGRLQLVSPDQAVSPEGVGGASADEAVQSLRQQLLMATESLEASNQENVNLSQRLVELETQLESMQKLIALRDESLAALQEGLAAGEQLEILPEPADSVAEDAAGGQADAALGSDAVDTLEIIEEDTAAAPAETQPAEAAAVAEKPQQPSKSAAAPAGDSLLDQVMAQPISMAIGGAILVLAILLVAMIVRRRRQDAEDEDFFATAPLTSENIGSALSGQPDAVAAGDGAPNEGFPMNAPVAAAATAEAADDLFVESGTETETFTGFGSGSGVIQAEESDIDPIAEADVYLAYRRYEQAESLLKEAINAEPERNELKLKLLEIYFVTKDQEAFEAQAEAIYASSSSSNPDLWGQVVEMGRELCPDHPLFAEAGGLPLGDDTVGEAVQEFDFDFDQDETAGSAAQAPSADLDLGLDPGDTAAVSEGGAGDADTEAGGLGSLDFDLDLDFGDEQAGQGIDTDEVAKTPRSDGPDDTVSSAGTLSDMAFDAPEAGLDLETPTLEAVSRDDDVRADFSDFDNVISLDKKAAGSIKETDFGDLELDLDELSMTPGSAGNVQDNSHVAAVASSSAREEGDWSLQPALSEFIQGDGHMEDEEYSLFENSDDVVGTKLDLAKAYIDMGDQDGALSILDEVVKEGSDTQRQEAEQLMRQIG